MTRTELLNYIGRKVFFTNPQGRLNTITIKKESVDAILDLQESGWKLIKPMERVGGECEACSSWHMIQ